MLTLRRVLWCALSFAVLFQGLAVQAANPVEEALKKLDTKRGVVAVLGLPEGDASFVTKLAANSELTVYFQSADTEQAAAVRKAADKARLLGTSVFVDSGSLDSIHLSHNLADGVLVDDSVAKQVSDKELLRVLNPKSTAHIGERKLTKPVPEGSDDWSHPYHGPDNNPQSNDKLVKGDFQTQFIGTPKFSPMPEQSVVAGGRIYKAMGHIAHKQNQNENLNTLLCINAFNGTIMWKRPLNEGFMIHRNTMIGTDDALYMGDHESCKVIDAKTGEVRREITIPKELTDGPTWKWMAVKDDVLFALVGNVEVKVETLRSVRRGLGHWPWGMWKGHDYNDPRTAFGYGRTLVAVDRKSGEVLWNYRDKEFLDARAICMKNGNIYCFTAEKFLACIDAKSGDLKWKNTDKDLLAAIGPNERAQHYVTGYATTCYMKASDDHLLFAGPQRKQMVVASAHDGKLQWTNETGNLQLVLRDEGIYAAGPQRTTGMRLDYKTGNVLSSFPGRRACTRATGCVDSIFFRAAGGTVRVMTENNQATHIAPMRPPCQDGVLIASGHLYWGPWMCGCQLSLYGNIGLRPVGEAPDLPTSLEDIQAESRVMHSLGQIQKLDIRPDDWVTYRGSNSRNDVTSVALGGDVEQAWSAEVTDGTSLPTAPVAAGGLVFVADRTGAVTAFDSKGKQVWKSFTAGPVYYPPSIAKDRLYVGSADGRVYTFEAKTGRLLWTFRVAPEDRWIKVFGKLVSRWPVAGGVVVENDTVYAAAGITHYDGTIVVALDAFSGKLKARNADSGTLAPEVKSGVSMQGNLTIVDGELRFLGGGVYERARYNLETLECRNEPKAQVTSQYRTAFYPWYPSYGKYVSLEYTCSDGNTLCADAAYEG
ncbi:MAG: PQQ-binding-like beta-propeller repeat protein, partial [Planctomycetes bacterium]|nr:PQQ-binding-like beta-propeller repeat protein [Planctomycetota bacterium]